MSASSFARGLAVAGVLAGGALVAAPAATASAPAAPVQGTHWCGDRWDSYDCDFDEWWYDDGWGYYDGW